MLREYGRGRMPLPCRFGWNSAYGPIPRGPSGSSSAGSSTRLIAGWSLQPPPACSLPLRQFIVFGPPVRRFETPWPYSWMMIPFSRSPSRMPGWLGCLRTVPDAGSAALIAAPSARVTLTAGTVGGASTKEPPRIGGGGGGVPVWSSATITALAPAASALWTFSRKSHLPLSTTAIAPVGKLSSRPQARLAFLPLPLASTIGPLVPAVVGGGPNRAHAAPNSPTPATTTWFWRPS